MAIDWTDPDYVFLLNQLRQGKVILFLGAGFSFDARNESGESPPLAGKLAQLLAEAAGFTYGNESLPIVYEAAQKQLGTAPLWTYLRKLYEIHGFADWYRILQEITWHRIYTMNIDNLVQKLYSKQSNQHLRTIINPAPIEERDALFKELQCIHLHGFVETPDKGLSFTLPDFGHLTAKPNPWYQSLIADLYYRSVIFIGTVLEETVFQHYVQMRDPKDRGTQEFRPKSYLVNPTIGKIRAAALKERNIVAVESTGEDFFRSLCDAIDISQLKLNAVRSEAFPNAIFRNDKPYVDEKLNRYFDLIRIDALPYVYKCLPDDFFMGAEPNWYDIAQNRDAIRTIERDLVATLPADRTDFSLVILHGPAGSGKTTTMMRTAHILASSGAQVYFAKDVERIDLTAVLDLADEARGKNRIFVFIDVLSRHMASLDAVYNRLRNTPNLTLVLADRANKYASMSHAFAILNPIEIRMPDLDEDDVNAVIGKLEQFGFLGVLRNKTPAQRTAAFMDSANKQLLVALREATSGQGFDIILRNEYGELAPQAQLAYTICCIAVGHGAPGVYIRHLLPCLGRSEFSKGVVIRDLLRGVLVPANHTETMVKPRHRLIAHWVATQIAPVGQKVDAVSKFLWQISSDIVPHEIKRRSPAYVAYRGMINSEALKETFSNDHEVILSIYEDLKTAYAHDFLFWLQYGMAQINAGRLDVAENYINQSLAMNPNSHQTKHQMGCLYLLQAVRSTNAVAVFDRAKNGIGLLIEQIHTHGDENSYPYHAYLVHVCRWYQSAGDLVTQKEWEALRQIGTEAIKKYPRDDMIKDAVNEVERQYMLRVARDRL